MDGEFPEEMKCPVCFEIPEKEIFQCENGHTLCHVCVERIVTCPQCRVDLDSHKIRVRALENLLDMMKFDCTYKSKGCKEKVSRKTFTSHTYNCHFGRTSIVNPIPTKFEDLRCDSCHKPFTSSNIYQCLECEEYKQCWSCMIYIKEHAFHQFALIESSEQHKLHEEKTKRGKARIPYVKCLQKDFEIDSNRVSAHVITTLDNLKCKSTGCARKPYLICLFCRGPHTVCSTHFNMEAEQHKSSHYFAVAHTEEARKSALKILEWDNLL